MSSNEYYNTITQQYWIKTLETVAGIKADMKLKMEDMLLRDTQYFQFLDLF